MWVKICGHTSQEGVQAAVLHGADALGFIFVTGGRRWRSPAQVAEWTTDLPVRVEKVGVFMDQPLPQILDIANAVGLTGIQLHGSEPPVHIGELQAVGYRVIKAVKLAALEDLVHLERYAGANALLLEPRVPGQQGGAGVALDLSLARAAVQRALALKSAAIEEFPAVILAGGLTPETVAAAMAFTGARAVDVSSGVETTGVKDPARIAAFIRAAKEAHYDPT